MKKILGLDLGANSIGWALVNEAETEQESSSIIRLGVRVNPLTVDEKGNFEKGKAITTSADRTLNRSARRNLQRYKLRRECLRSILCDAGFISKDTILTETGHNSTFEIYRLRAKAVHEEVSLEEFSRILFCINKKRGYKSSRKANADEGVVMDGMAVAKELYERNITPGEYCNELLANGKKHLPDFYRSDLQNELDRIWEYQRRFYPDILTDEFKEQLIAKSQLNTSKIFLAKYQIYTAENKGANKKEQAYRWRTEALREQLQKEVLAYVICNVNGEISNSSGYLGSIGDRSKQLFFNKQTVGEFLCRQLEANRHCSLKNMVFYRQDYLDEFEAIWERQKEYHPELTPELKKDIRDVVIFYQRPLKSKKGLLDICELEGRMQECVIDGRKTSRWVGPKVCPKSSPIFQEFRIWQRLNDTVVTESMIDPVTKRKEYVKRDLTIEEKETLAIELSVVKKLSKADALKLLYGTNKDRDLNFKEFDGDTTFSALFEKFLTIVELSGHDLSRAAKTAADRISAVRAVFEACGYNADLLCFDSSVEPGKCYEQPYYKLWHLLYSYEGDNSKSGVEKLIDKIVEISGFDREYATILAGITFKPDYGNLSSKAMHKILPYLKAGNEYSLACEYAGYKHSKSSLTKEEIETRELKSRLEILPKNSLRNPVVEKILNQMVHVVNDVIEQYGKPDEIRIEMARDLKRSAQQRANDYESMNKAAKENEVYKQILQSEFNILHPSRNDIVRYKLYKELEPVGYKTLYSNTYIPREKLFTKEFDIEHIIPKTRLFNDSFSNKTLESRSANIEKGNMTAYDYVVWKYGDKNDEYGIAAYESRIDRLYKDRVISQSKWKNLKMKEHDIPDDFIERDLRNSQYIARQALSMLHEIARVVVPTVGSITDCLREDWGLIDVMKELNWEKYDKLGMTECYQDKDGRNIRRIKDWTKRNDHRHHAMDALTIAFTKQAYIQYLNNLNARGDKSSVIYAIERKELERKDGKWVFKAPMLRFREEAKKHLQMILVSIKAKNKVATRNVNKSKKIGGYNRTVQLTPRGQLHLETVYARRKQISIEVKSVEAAFNADMISRVVNDRYRNALLSRLMQYGGDAKKAFTGKNSLDKTPLYIDDLQTKKVPKTLKLYKEEIIYTVRKDITKDLKIEKVLDGRVRERLKERLDAFGGDAKSAFSNLDANPIWLNEEKEFAIKRVTVKGLNNAISLHEKRDNTGAYVLDGDGRRIPADYVNTGNNHHVAIFRDEEGNLQEHIVSFIEATARYIQHLPVVDKEYNSHLGWKFLFTMKQNEYFLFPDAKTGFDPSEIDLYDPANYARISPYLYRVQKFATKDYVFRHHLETTVEDDNNLKDIAWKRITNMRLLEGIVKVRLNHIGEIVKVGEE